MKVAYGIFYHIFLVVVKFYLFQKYLAAFDNHMGDMIKGGGFTMGVLGKICPKIPRNVIFARISLFLVPMALTCIKEHMKIEKGR